MTGAAGPLHLATVVVDVEPAPTAGAGPSVPDLLMEVDDVVSVRPDGGADRWLYRVDVESADPDRRERLATAPAAHLADRLGRAVEVVRVGWLSPAERRTFHARFDAAGPQPTRLGR